MNKNINTTIILHESYWLVCWNGMEWKWQPSGWRRKWKRNKIKYRWTHRTWMYFLYFSDKTYCLAFSMLLSGKANTCSNNHQIRGRNKLHIDVNVDVLNKIEKHALILGLNPCPIQSILFIHLSPFCLISPVWVGPLCPLHSSFTTSNVLWQTV